MNSKSSSNEEYEGEATAGQEVRLEATIAPQVTFATHQADIEVIAELIIKNGSSNVLENLQLFITSEPEVIRQQAIQIERVSPESEFRVKDRRVSLSGSLLNSLTERIKASLRLELRDGDEVIASAEHDLTALARNEWGGVNTMPELIASFVMPNDNGIAQILKDASKLLERAGKLSSIEGYQGRSAKRSWELASAVWSAVSGLALTYSEPPASFEKLGQKIRFPSQVVSQGLASCLDSVLLFAAALEQAGMYPVVLFLKGHALIGCWLKPKNLSSLTVDEPSELRKAVAANELIVFESTMSSSGKNTSSFTAAIEAGSRQISEENQDDFIFAIDIRRARDRGLKPIAVTNELQTSTSTGTELSPAELLLEEAPTDFEFDSDFETPVSHQDVSSRLDRWKRNLLDLTKRNRLINFRESRTALRFHCPDPILLYDLIQKETRLKLISPDYAEGRSSDQFRLNTGKEYLDNFATEALKEREEVVVAVTGSNAKEAESELSKSLVELFRRARSDVEEGGANTLYLGLGVLLWKDPGDSSGRTYRAPVVLVPVQLDRASARTQPKLRAHEDDPLFNLTLLRMLQRDFEIDLTEFENELPTSGDGSADIEAVWRTVRRKIQPVDSLELAEEVVLGRFSFTKYLMWKDLADRTEALKQNRFVKHLLDTPREPYSGAATFQDDSEKSLDDRIDPADVMAPLNADASQLRAIYASGDGGDFVLEGPPGTGKSETIANIIAHNIGLGRRVLFASDKMAALNVVYSRLREVGLGDLCLELHSSRANKKEVLTQLSEAWNTRSSRSATQWSEKARELKLLRSRLNGFVAALHDQSVAGISAYEAIGRAARYGHTHRVALDWPRTLTPFGEHMDDAALTKLQDLAERTGLHYSQLQPGDADAFNFVRHEEWSYGWATELVQATTRLLHAAQTLDKQSEEIAEAFGFSNRARTVGDQEALGELTSLLTEHSKLGSTVAVSDDPNECTNQLASALKGFEKAKKASENLSFKFELHRLAESPLDEWASKLASAKARFFLFRAKPFRILRESIRTSLGLEAGTAAKPEQELEALNLVQTSYRKGLKALESAALTTLELDGPLDLEKLKRILENGEALVRAATYTALNEEHDVDVLRKRIGSIVSGGPRTTEYLQRFSRFSKALATFTDARNQFLQLANAEQGDLPDLTGELIGTLEQIAARERRLNSWSQWVSVAREARDAGLGALVEALESGFVEPGTALEAFRTAYATWVAPLIIDATPELQRFSQVEHEAAIETFSRVDREFTKLTAEYVKASARGEVPARSETRSKGASTGYGLLARELQKKQRHKPVRQLLDGMGDTLTDLTPCLMMSPSSVAQFLPANANLFDLVVFDEASQILVSDAIGVIARGKQCIIVGDTKQLPPTTFFERQDDDEVDDDVQDLESILDEAIAARLPSLQLMGHYRSRHESLISFSNYNYYGGSLVTYPSTQTKDTAVSLRLIDGTYARGGSRTNPKEAHAVVAEIVRRLKDPVSSKHSIGVVTMNSQQQKLIEDLLDAERSRDTALERFFREPTPAGSDDYQPVFVKNLETVQGDQRDVILISVVYGPSEPGAGAMSMNFGPLNKEGGERRLNVAVTRATTEVVVFSSFAPQMIDLNRTSAQGVRDLKTYLDFAARGPIALGQAVRAVSESDYDSDFERAVADRLREKGWTVRTQIGVSRYRIDLGVVHPDEPGSFLAGVECDGATYHSLPAARDRDRIRQNVLEGLGWNILRVWSTAFFADEITVIEEIHKRLEELLEVDRQGSQGPKEEEHSAPTLSASPEAPPQEYEWAVDGAVFRRNTVAAHDPANEEKAARVPGATPPTSTAQAATGERGSSNEAEALPKRVPSGSLPMQADAARFYDDDYQPTLKAIVQRVIDDEGPINFRLLAEKTARLHGFERTGKEIRSITWRASIASGRKHYIAPDGSNVFWAVNQVVGPRYPFRGSVVNDTDRGWRHLPYPEKVDLVVTAGADKAIAEDVARAVAHELGMRRVTQKFVEAVSTIMTEIAD